MEGQLTRLSPSRLERITDLLQCRYIDTGKIAGCQALVAQHGEVAYSRCFGAMDLGRGTPWADDTVVRIYSMTKPVVSVALMMLWERGLFQLDEPVLKVLPEWGDLKVWVSGEGEAMQTEPLRRPISFRDLLSHTSGLTYGTLLETIGAPAVRHPVDAAYKALKVRMEREEDLDAFVGKLGRLPLRYQPGQQWMYSLATDVIGAVVQRISGKRLDAFLKDEIFGPLGMVDTDFTVPPANAERFAACYARSAQKALVLQDDPKTSPYLQEQVFLSGGGGLVSTMADYHRFCEMLRRGGDLDGTRIIGPRTLALMTRNHLIGGASLAEIALDSFSETTPVGVGFGLGFAMTTDGVRAGTPGEGEYYWGGAASTLFWVDPREDLIVIFLAQLLPSTTFDFRGQLRNIVYSAIEVSARDRPSSAQVIDPHDDLADRPAVGEGGDRFPALLKGEHLGHFGLELSLRVERQQIGDVGLVPLRLTRDEGAPEHAAHVATFEQGQVQRQAWDAGGKTDDQETPFPGDGAQCGFGIIAPHRIIDHVSAVGAERVFELRR